MYQVIHYAMKTAGDDTRIKLIYSNKTENDILCREEFDALAKEHKGQFECIYVLSNPSDDWKGEKVRTHGGDGWLRDTGTRGRGVYEEASVRAIQRDGNLHVWSSRSSQGLHHRPLGLGIQRRRKHLWFLELKGTQTNRR